MKGVLRHDGGDVLVAVGPVEVPCHVHRYVRAGRDIHARAAEEGLRQGDIVKADGLGGRVRHIAADIEHNVAGAVTRYERVRLDVSVELERFRAAAAGHRPLDDDVDVRPRVRAELAALVLGGHRRRLHSGYRRFGRDGRCCRNSGRDGCRNRCPGRLRRRRGGRRGRRFGRCGRRRPGILRIRSIVFRYTEHNKNTDSDKQENEDQNGSRGFFHGEYLPIIISSGDRSPCPIQKAFRCPLFGRRR